MLGLPAALILLAQAAADAGAPPDPKPPAKPAAEACSPRTPDASASEIVICAERPNGYRIDPDVLKAKREKKQALAGRPKPPNKMKDTSCTVVGPAGCIAAPTINLLAAAATAAEMAARLSRGQEIGSMFITDPQPDEYQLYKEAKAQREAEEAEKAAKTKTKATVEQPAQTPGN
jgi:hypothetical protein